MVPVAQWLERVTVDDEVEGSTPFRHPLKNPFRGFFYLFITTLQNILNKAPGFNAV